MSAAKQRGRWKSGDAADSKEVRQGGSNTASGIVIGPLSSESASGHTPPYFWGRVP